VGFIPIGRADPAHLGGSSGRGASVVCLLPETLHIKFERIAERVCQGSRVEVALVKLRNGCRQSFHVVDHDMGIP
jgi:hypothetical protein